MLLCACMRAHTRMQGGGVFFFFISLSLQQTMQENTVWGTLKSVKHTHIFTGNVWCVAVKAADVLRGAPGFLPSMHSH